jgi:capsular exopolysaccharide synthesis family protein
MRPLDYLRILRRRWWIPVIGLLIGVLLAFVTAPSDQEVARATVPKVSFRATNYVLANEASLDRGSPISWDRLALYTVRGEVPRQSIKDLGGQGVGEVLQGQEEGEESGDENNSAQRKRRKATDPSKIDFKNGKGSVKLYGPQGLITVAAVPDPAIGGLAIVATASKESAPIAADAFAENLIAKVDELARQDYDARLAELQGQRTDLLASEAVVDQQLVAAGADIPLLQSLQQRRLDLERNIQDLNTDINSLIRRGPELGTLKSLESAANGRLEVVTLPGGTTLSSDQRLILGGAIGALLGLVLLIVMELLGARVRDVPGTEGAARMPVVAEIPVVKMNRADRFVVATAAEPSSLIAEAYRSLRTSLLAMWQRHPRNTAVVTDGTAGPEGRERGRPLRTLLVTSPGPAEGKSISVVNLAAAFAETGMSVIIIDSDFRRPTQCRYLDRPKNPNIGDLDLTCTSDDLEAVLQDTDIPGVRLAASAPTKADPGHAIAVAKAVVHAAEALADIVLVDSPPLLLANDASDLALGVDATVLLARSGWTRRNAVVSSADLLRRLEAPVIGIVIVGAEHGVRAGYYGYYGYYGYGYGYAHPGEVSLVSRLMPWKAGRKAGGRSSGQGNGHGRPPVPSGREAPGEPWV